MSKPKKQIKWRVCGDSGWNRKGTLQSYEVEIVYYQMKRHYQISFHGDRHGSYPLSDEGLEAAKADAEILLPGWIAKLQADQQARKAAALEEARLRGIHQERLAAVLASLKALGINVYDNFGGSVGMDVATAESLVSRLSAITATGVKSAA